MQKGNQKPLHALLIVSGYSVVNSQKLFGFWDFYYVSPNYNRPFSVIQHTLYNIQS